MSRSSLVYCLYHITIIHRCIQAVLRVLLIVAKLADSVDQGKSRNITCLCDAESGRTVVLFNHPTRTDGRFVTFIKEDAVMRWRLDQTDELVNYRLSGHSYSDSTSSNDP